jgi:hypothetical protein
MHLPASPSLLPALGLLALGSLIVFQIVSSVRLSNRLRAAAEMSARLDRLTAALGLLTDTTEGGLSALTAELERLGRRTIVTPRDPKRSIALRRDEFSQDALDAAMAASESRVHLGLFTSATGEGHASLRA